MDEEQKLMEQTAPVQQMETPEERPNRKAFSERFGKRHKDIDFEDKEARYGALSEDADRLDSYEQSGRSLSNVFERNRWLASMLEALREDEKLDPVSWMADNGIDISEALEDEEYRKTISERISAFQKRQIDGENAMKEREKNLIKSGKALESIGVDEEEAASLWGTFFNDILDPALRGEISKETWKMVRNAVHYDDDIASAREEAAMTARNEKIRNRTKQTEDEIPPSLPQGADVAPTQKKGKKNDFWSDMT